MENNRVINRGNSASISEVCLPVIELTMLRYENLFYYYADEPLTVLVSQANNEKEEFRRVFRVICQMLDGDSFAWSIYAGDLEELDHIVVRKVVWHYSMDKKNVIERARFEREKLLTQYPSIETETIYLKNNLWKETVVAQLATLDEELTRGITLRDNDHPDYSRIHTNIGRWYDWGKIELAFSPLKVNEEIERKISSIIETIDQSIKNQTMQVLEILLNYSIPPTVFKHYSEGD
ncbi:hypothetical protein JZO70_08645 [Enterococcus sp. 669A]|uniref:Uncharacterized protein n=1 Tax=Candidatus Enterococcus moelleringii TaxID=2815325 RepID=A0ABS3LAY7_9ENTE|nr:hypothetical protein [Enterococcus sp. 669A]MBO1306225.1 hypothetical protein [Enterococcus sp. 669A]